MATRRRNIIAVGLVALVAPAGTAIPGDFVLEPAGSQLRFTAIQQGARFESRFERFTTRLRFDPAQPDTGRIRATIDLGSVDTGNPERDEILLTADWFGAALWPAAVFEAERITPDGDAWLAAGRLSLRNVSRPVTLRFFWTPATGDQPARLVGTAGVRRLNFGVGGGEWRDTSYVGDPVEIQVDILLVPD